MTRPNPVNPSMSPRPSSDFSMPRNTARIADALASNTLLSPASSDSLPEPRPQSDFNAPRNLARIADYAPLMMGKDGSNAQIPSSSPNQIVITNPDSSLGTISQLTFNSPLSKSPITQDIAHKQASVSLSFLPPLTLQNNSLALSTDSSLAISNKALSVQLSKSPNNSLTLQKDGLYVPPSSGGTGGKIYSGIAPITVNNSANTVSLNTDSSLISANPYNLLRWNTSQGYQGLYATIYIDKGLEGDGTGAGIGTNKPLSVLLSQDKNNTLSFGSDKGLYSPAPDLTQYALTSALPKPDNTTITSNNGVWSAKVSGGSVKVDNQTIIQAPDGTISLNNAPYSTDNYNMLRITQYSPSEKHLSVNLNVSSGLKGNGVYNSPLSLNLSQDKDNLLSIQPDNSLKASSAVNSPLVGDGTANNPLGLYLSPDSNSILSIQPDGSLAAPLLKTNPVIGRAYCKTWTAVTNTYSDIIGGCSIKLDKQGGNSYASASLTIPAGGSATILTNTGVITIDSSHDLMKLNNYSNAIEIWDSTGAYSKLYIVKDGSGQGIALCAYWNV